MGHLNHKFFLLFTSYTFIGSCLLLIGIYIVKGDDTIRVLINILSILLLKGYARNGTGHFGLASALAWPLVIVLGFFNIWNWYVK